jgi:hypothetical protein
MTSNLLLMNLAKESKVLSKAQRSTIHDLPPSEAIKKSKYFTGCEGKTYSSANPIPRLQDSDLSAVLEKNIGTA